jgi:NADPH-dependent glutamate synthase beta subunit-like oxidoreductase/TM2 domain-containing membrane protein YozV
MLEIDVLKQREKRKRKIAAILSLFIPGLGQIMRRRIISGLFFLFVFTFFIWLLTEIWQVNYGIIGLFAGLFFFYCINIADAYKGPFKNSAPCEDKCPVGINIPLFVTLIREGRFDDALDVIKDRMPFPSVCGRICYHPCETVCSLRQKEGAIAIEPLKRAASDFGTATPPKAITNSRGRKTVGIIGAGPAGLSAAYFLTRMGYPVTIFESAKRPGGMLLTTIPSYRLPEDTAKYDIERILATGIEIKAGITVGKDTSLNELRKDYKAILLAIGAQNAKRLRIEGVESKDVLYGIPFLKDAKIGKGKVSKKRVIVIGGGNVGIDCARSAIRLGAKSADLVCLETRDLSSKDRMPAHKWEIEEAEEEGVKIHDCWGPKKILLKEKRVTGLELVKCTSVYKGEGRKFNPQFDESKHEKIDGAIVIIAIGQYPDFSFLPPPIKQKIVINNTVIVNHSTMETPIRGIFAVGDITDGAKTVVDAVEMGRRAAIGVDWYLRRVGRFRRTLEKFIDFDYQPYYRIPRRKSIKGTRLEQNLLPKENAITSFSEVDLGFTKEEARKEAARCEQCNRKY